VDGIGSDWMGSDRIGSRSGFHIGKEVNGAESNGVERSGLDWTGLALLCFNLGREHERDD
jgi:hypothetical protein